MKMPLRAFILLSFALVGCGSASETATVAASGAEAPGEGGRGGDQDIVTTTASGGGGPSDACTPGEERPCYDGPAGTEGVGSCASGTQQCSGKEWGSWGPCEGAVLPIDDACNGLDDDCDGVVDQDCECADGVEQPCYSGPAATEGVGVCQGGTRACVNGAFEACEGEILPSIETCDNGTDDDCNGAVDEGCGPPPFEVTDFDVSDDGSLVVVGKSSNPTWTVRAQCYGPAGNVVVPDFLVHDTAGGLVTEMPFVARSRVAKNFAIIARVWTIPWDASSRVFVVRLYDAACQPTTPAWTLPAPDEYRDLALDDQGNVALVTSELAPQGVHLLRLYAPDGTLKSQPLGMTNCKSMGVHVAVNRATGDGIVTCQGHFDDPIRFRRFSSAGAWIDPAEIAVAPSDGDNSSWYDSHNVGMNTNGEFVIAWANAGWGANPSAEEAAFFDDDGAMVAHTTIGDAGDTVYDEHRWHNAKVQVHEGDFILHAYEEVPNVSRPGYFFNGYRRFTPSGVLVHSATVGVAPPKPGFNTRQLVVDVAGNTWVQDAPYDTAVQKNVFLIGP